MPLSYTQLTQPAAEPVTLAQAKLQLNVEAEFTDDDTLISGLIVAAREYAENFCNRSFYTRNMQLTLDFFPYPTYGGTINPNDRHVMYGRYWHELAIKLPRPSCTSVTSITYVDLDGTAKTLDPSQYSIDLTSEPARIVPAPGLYWPYTQTYLPGSVKVLYTAGSYGDGVTIDTCPQSIKQAMLLLVSHWYSNRNAAAVSVPRAIELGVQSLLDPYKFETFKF